MKTFRSKTDSAIVMILAASFIGPAILFISQKDWKGALLMCAVLAFIVYLFLETKYYIKGDILQVKAGFLVNKRIKIMSIQSVMKTDSVLSAPANSITDRIEIKYEDSKSVIISPKEKAAFVTELLAVNPAIVVQL